MILLPTPAEAVQVDACHALHGDAVSARTGTTGIMVHVYLLVLLELTPYLRRSVRCAPSAVLHAPLTTNALNAR